MTEINDLQAGKAGVYLVCADLILAGYIAFPSEEGLCFDVVVEVGGRLLKVQVKTTRRPRAVPQRAHHVPGYLFNIKRTGKNGSRCYATGDVDLFALVALDSREIGYLAFADVKQSMVFRCPLLESNYRNEKIQERNKRIRELREAGMSYRQIAAELGVDRSYAQRVVTGREKESHAGKYLRDLLFADAVRRAGFATGSA